MSESYRCILLFGAPGVGKGTQGKRLGKEKGFVHLATGDIFRSLDKESPLGRKFVEVSSRGELVPDRLTVDLWSDFVAGLIRKGAYDPAHEVLLLDGIPRSDAQARMLADRIEPLAVIHLVAGDLDALVERMRLRAEKEGRHDDADEAVIRRRFKVYQQETAPALAHYDPALVIEIDGMGTIDEVTQRIRDAVRPVWAAHFGDEELQQRRGCMG